MSLLIEEACQTQATLFAERLDDYINDNNEIRVICAFVDSQVLSDIGFKTIAAYTGRPSYHSAILLKLFVY